MASRLHSEHTLATDASSLPTLWAQILCFWPMPVAADRGGMQLVRRKRLNNAQVKAPKLGYAHAT
ncbi:hypothetical protein ACWGKP_34740 [Brevibacillus sp. NPDC055896]